MRSPPSLIFLSGKKRAGKDTFAQQLMKRYAYHRIAFADVLKDEVAAKWNLNREEFDLDTHKETKPPGFAYTRRQLCQIHGREKRQMDPEYWIHKGQEQINARLAKGELVVVTDARFPNELAPSHYATEDMCTVRIERPNRADDLKADRDITETALDAWPFDVQLIHEEGNAETLCTQFETYLHST